MMLMELHALNVQHHVLIVIVLVRQVHRDVKVRKMDIILMPAIMFYPALLMLLNVFGTLVKVPQL